MKYNFNGKELKVKVKIGKYAKQVKASDHKCLIVGNELWIAYNTEFQANKLGIEVVGD